MCVCVSCNSNEVGALGLSLYCNFVFEPVLISPPPRFPNIRYGHETRGIEKKCYRQSSPRHLCIEYMGRVLLALKSTGYLRHVLFVQKHVQVCEHATVTCRWAPRGCPQHVLRKDLEEHARSCVWRPERCQLCGAEVSHCEMQVTSGLRVVGGAHVFKHSFDG